MLKKLGAVFFFCFIFIAALALANFLSLRVYGKPLPAMVRDLLFLASRK